MNWHPDRPPMWHEPWWQTWHGLIPLLLILVLAGVVIWLVVRMSRLEGARAAGVTSPTPAPSPVPTQVPAAAPIVDPALEQARMRYAGGEIDRDAFLRIWTDLGGAPPAGGAERAPGLDEDPRPEGA